MTISTVCSISQETHVPSHLDRFRVEFTPGEFQSSLKAVKDFKAGEVVCRISGFVASKKTRTSFQSGENEHNEFNSDLVFANHSCDPNIALDLSSPCRDEWRAVAVKDVAAGDELTWFYPTTEWDAWGSGFACGCRTKACLGQYSGSKSLPLSTLAKYKYINPHVWRLAGARDCCC